jgi:FdhD protein
MESNKGIMTSAVLKVLQKEASIHDDMLAVEEPLEIKLCYMEKEVVVYKSLSVTMRTPGNDAVLGLGFLFTEGIITGFESIEKIEVRDFENIVALHFKPGYTPVLKNVERNFYTTSSCGVCGKSSIEAIKTVSIFGQTKDAMSVPVEVIYTLPELLRRQQAIFESTGGLHAAALFDGEGHFEMLQEDVGRHNALDKLIGSALQQGLLPLQTHILLLSGRASFELIQKATMAGIKLVAAVGAPSSLAVSLAKENDMTLIGFLRGNRCNIYTGAQRVHCE